MKKFAIVVAGITLLIFGVIAAPAVAMGGGHTPVAVCHYTPDHYQYIVIDDDGLHGHGHHAKDVLLYDVNDVCPSDDPSPSPSPSPEEHEPYVETSASLDTTVECTVPLDGTATIRTKETITTVTYVWDTVLNKYVGQEPVVEVNVFHDLYQDEACDPGDVGEPEHPEAPKPRTVVSTPSFTG